MEETERALRAATLYGDTLIDPAALILTLAMGILVLAIPRDKAVIPLLLTGTFIPVAQRLVVGGLDFTMIRLILLFAFARLAIRQEYVRIRLNTMDKTILAWIIVGTLVYTAQHLTVGALVNRLGGAFETVGAYLLVRATVQDRKSLYNVIRTLEWAVLILAIFMALEWSTGRNFLHFLGGVPEFTPLREGRLRCQGAFNHPILAGTFAASIFPIAFGDFLHCVKRGRSPLTPMFAVGASIAAAALSVSSGPVIALVVGIIGWCFWGLRLKMKTVRWTIAGFLLAVELVTKNPIWHLVIYLNIIGGSTGYHRYRLIQAAVDRFGEWALLGTASTLHWGHFLHDITNQYILEGVRGGVWTMALFVAVLSLGFANVGRAMRRIDQHTGLSKKERKGWSLLLFGLGVSLFVHSISFLSVSYFGQIVVLWKIFLAVLASLPQSVRGVSKRTRARRPKPRRATETSTADTVDKERPSRLSDLLTREMDPSEPPQRFFNTESK